MIQMDILITLSFENCDKYDRVFANRVNNF